MGLNNWEKVLGLLAVLALSMMLNSTVFAAGSISGLITDGSNPIPNIDVEVQSERCHQGSWLGGSQTAADGTYTITGIPAGIVYVRAWDNLGRNYVSIWYNGKSTVTQRIL